MVKWLDGLIVGQITIKQSSHLAIKIPTFETPNRQTLKQ